MHLFIPGGAGRIGSLLVPALLAAGHEVTVYDLFPNGEGVFDSFKSPQLTQVKGDVCDLELMEEALNGCEIILYLAPSLDIKSFKTFVSIAKRKVAKRFIFTSSYDEPLITYEEALIKENGADLSCTILRPGTILEKSPRRPIQKDIPVIHIDDLTSIYLNLISTPKEITHGEMYNAGYVAHESASSKKLETHTDFSPKYTASPLDQLLNTQKKNVLFG